MRLTTPGQSRIIDVTDEVLWDWGRVVYRVAGVGAFTLERDPDGYSVDPDREYTLQCTYGVLDTERRYYFRGALPEAPVMFGITIGGAAVYRPSRFHETNPRTGMPYWSTLPMQRATEHEVRGTVPDKTEHRITDIVAALTEHYVHRLDREDIDHRQAVRLAPQRLTGHQRDINDLAEQIAALQAKLDAQRALADVQYALLHPDEQLAG